MFQISLKIALFLNLVNNPLQNVLLAALLKDIIIHWLDLTLLSLYSSFFGGKKGEDLAGKITRMPKFGGKSPKF